ncbi:MAG: 2,3-diaminopropionate biosynthesis protein SbnA [Candidatus Aminicenantes bacterium]|jgi:cysteine synthase A
MKNKNLFSTTQKCNLDRAGHTPLVQIQPQGLENINLFAKLEFFNPTGSVKDRAASYLIKKLLENKEIDKHTTLIESSSGNFAIALSAYCKKNNLKFIAVVDPCISPINEVLIRAFGAKIIKINVPDRNGGYLLNRIKKVKELINEIDNSYWVNQYANPYNAEAYYHSLGNEICRSLDNIDYLFMGVSSGGTITGVSNKIKERFPQAKVIAVDIYGSVIFGHPPQKRYIPGIGSSMVPEILKKAKIDDVVIVDEVSTIDMCHELLKKHYIFAGGSSGSAFAAIKKYFAGKKINKKVNVVTVFADRGERYANTIYNEKWCRDFKKNHLYLNKPGKIRN